MVRAPSAFASSFAAHEERRSEKGAVRKRDKSPQQAAAPVYAAITSDDERGVPPVLLVHNIKKAGALWMETAGNNLISIADATSSRRTTMKGCLPDECTKTRLEWIRFPKTLRFLIPTYMASNLEFANSPFVSEPPTAQNAVDLFKNWASYFPATTSLVTNGKAGLFEDERIYWMESKYTDLAKRTLRDLNVLELGPLEAGHTYMLES